MSNRETNNVRYRSMRVPLTCDEAQSQHDAAVNEAMEAVNDAIAALTQCIEAPLACDKEELVAVHLGDEGYDDAPFTNTLIMQGRAMVMEVSKQPIPWTELLSKGTYPTGLGECISKLTSP